MLDVPPPLQAPNVVVLASVVQYVPDLWVAVARLLGWLAPGGELHVLDSPLYRPEEIAAARERTRRYYAQLGVPQMAEAYHHHAWSALDGFDVDVAYRPDSVRRRLERRLGRVRSPFPWIRIRP